MSCANVPATPVRMSVSRTSVSSPRPTGQVSVGICWHAQLEGRDWVRWTTDRTPGYSKDCSVCGREEHHKPRGIESDVSISGLSAVCFCLACWMRCLRCWFLFQEWEGWEEWEDINVLEPFLAWRALEEDHYAHHRSSPYTICFPAVFSLLSHALCSSSNAIDIVLFKHFAWFAPWKDRSNSTRIFVLVCLVCLVWLHSHHFGDDLLAASKWCSAWIAFASAKRIPIWKLNRQSAQSIFSLVGLLKIGLDANSVGSNRDSDHLRVGQMLFIAVLSTRVHVFRRRFRQLLCSITLMPVGLLPLRGPEGEYTTFLANAFRPWPDSWSRWWVIFLWLATMAP